MFIKHPNRPSFSLIKIIAAFILIGAFLYSCNETDKSTAESNTKSADKIKWYSYKKGIAQGKKEGKKIYINFHADWCRYCKKMDKETFKNKSVISYLNENFISIKVDSDKERSTSSEFNVKGLPDNWFLTEKGERIGNQPGYLPDKMMLQLLEHIHTEKYKNK